MLIYRSSLVLRLDKNYERSLITISSVLISLARSLLEHRVDQSLARESPKGDDRAGRNRGFFLLAIAMAHVKPGRRLGGQSGDAAALGERDTALNVHPRLPSSSCLQETSSSFCQPLETAVIWDHTEYPSPKGQPFFCCGEVKQRDRHP